MPDSERQEDAPASPLVHYVAPLLIVLAVGALFLLGKPGKKHAVESGATDQAVKVGQDYYVLVTTMEFHPRQLDGDKWDVGGSAPDLYYLIQWQGRTVFDTKNDVAEDTFIGKWFGLGGDVSITDLGKILLPSGKRLSPRNAIKAALVAVDSEGQLIIRAYDNDAVRDDAAGNCALRLADLRTGDNVFFINARGRATRDPSQVARNRGGLKRLILRVVDASLPVEKLVSAFR